MFGTEIWAVAMAAAVTLFAGFVKGAVGFAMPMIMVLRKSRRNTNSTRIARIPPITSEPPNAFRRSPVASEMIARLKDPPMTDQSKPI